jgi:hypothetical protein
VEAIATIVTRSSNDQDSTSGTVPDGIGKDRMGCT